MANKTKAELLEEIEAKNSEIKDLKNEIQKLDRYKQYEDMANEVFALRESFVNAGFSKAESFNMLKTILEASIPQALKSI